MENFGMSMLWFWICYIIVTLVGIVHTVFNIYVLKMSPMDKNSMGEGYEKTKPWHPLYNIILFSIFGSQVLNVGVNSFTTMCTVMLLVFLIPPRRY